MAEPVEITVEHSRVGESEEPEHLAQKEQTDGNLDPGEALKQQIDGQKQEIQSTPQEDFRTKFYELYRKEAEDHDKDFIKKYDEDLNTTLIFAGLFSAVTSAFVLEVHSNLNPDPNAETAALLRVLLHKIDNTTFGSEVPAIPQWTGPPHTIVQVQCLLLTSLAASLFAAFLAMLGKQWLNRYSSVDVRGSAIERSQNRQRKLNGIVAWYFDYLMESLPLMLQAALLLFGCALAFYLWGVDTTVASVALGVTSFGIIFYISVVMAGAASVSCPYQTPAARILRYCMGVFHEGCSAVIKQSKTIAMLRKINRRYLSDPWWSRRNIRWFMDDLFHRLPSKLAGYCRRAAAAAPPLLFETYRRVWSRFSRSHSPPNQTMDQRPVALDFDCISWVLRTSLDKDVILSTMKFLTTVLTSPCFDSTIAVDCLAVLIDCIYFGDGIAFVTGGSEQLATTSANCFLSLFCSLSVTNPRSSVITDIRQRYGRTFDPETDFSVLPFHFSMATIHHLFISSRRRYPLDWRHYQPSTQEYTSLAHTLVEAARFEYKRREHSRKVPRWLLRFALRGLSQNPLPPAPVVIDCLLMVAIDLDCEISKAVDAWSNESVRMEYVFQLIIQKIVAISGDGDTVELKGKAIMTVFQYASQRNQDDTPSIRAFPHAASFWSYTLNGSTTVQLWIAAASAVPYTDNIGQCVVDTLLQLALYPDTHPHISKEAWSWLNRRPPLSLNRRWSHTHTRPDAVRAVLALKDIEIFKSFLFLVRSQWGDMWPSEFREMYTLIQEHLSGIEMRDHCAELLRSLVDISDQFDLGFEHFHRTNPTLTIHGFNYQRRQFWGLEKVSFEVCEDSERTLAKCHSKFMCAIPFPSP